MSQQIDVGLILNFITQVGDIDVQPQEVQAKAKQAENQLLSLLASASRVAPTLALDVGLEPSMSLDKAALDKAKKDLDDLITRLGEDLDVAGDEAVVLKAKFAKSLKNALKLESSDLFSSADRDRFEKLLLRETGLSDEALNKLDENQKKQIKKFATLSKAWAKEIKALQEVLTRETHVTVDSGDEVNLVSSPRVVIPALGVLSNTLQEQGSRLSKAVSIPATKQLQRRNAKAGKIGIGISEYEKLLGDDFIPGVNPADSLYKKGFDSHRVTADTNLEDIKAAFKAEIALKEGSYGLDEDKNREIREGVVALKSNLANLRIAERALKGNSLAKSGAEFQKESTDALERAANLLKISEQDIQFRDIKQEDLVKAFRSPSLDSSQRAVVLKDLKKAQATAYLAYARSGGDEKARGETLREALRLDEIVQAINNEAKQIASQQKQGAYTKAAGQPIRANELTTLRKQVKEAQGEDKVRMQAELSAKEEQLKKAKLAALTKALAEANKTFEQNQTTENRESVTQLESQIAKIEANLTQANIKRLEKEITAALKPLMTQKALRTPEGYATAAEALKPGNRLDRLNEELAKLRNEVGKNSATRAGFAEKLKQAGDIFAQAPNNTIEEILAEITAADLKEEKAITALLAKLSDAEKEAKTLDTAGLLPKDTKANLKQARTRLEAAQKQATRNDFTTRSETGLRGILKDVQASEDKKKEARKLLRALLRHKLASDPANMAEELAKLAADPSEPLALSREFSDLADKASNNNQQKLAYLKKALSAAETARAGEAGAETGKNLRDQITSVEEEILNAKHDLDNRITSLTKDTPDFQKVASALERDIRKRYPSGEARATKLQQIAQVRQQVIVAAETQARDDLDKLIEAIKDIDEEVYKTLLREKIRGIIRQLRGDNTNERLKEALQASRSELNRLKGPAADRLGQAERSPLFTEGQRAAEAAEHRPMEIPAGSRHAALYYYRTQVALDERRLQDPDTSTESRPQLLRNVERNTANIQTLRREIVGTIGWVHKLQVAVESFFRYAGVYGAGYQLLNAFQAFTGEVFQLDKALKSIQAVAQATESQMVGVESAIKNIATTTQFSTRQMAEATQVLAQAGVEAQDLPKVLDSVAKFASATASDLTLAADVLSSLREVFTDFGDIFRDSRLADSLTNAVNISKLNVQDLQVITSLGAQTAKAFNISSDQFLAAAATLSNVGIRKSTVGTGLRQAMLEILNPDAATLEFLKQRYAKIGEMLSDEAIKGRFQAFQATSDPLSSALTEMKRIGVAGSARYDFRRVVDIRAENVLLPLMDSLETYQQNIAKIAQSGSAAKGAEVQMTAFLNTWNRLQSEIDSAGHSIITHFLPALRGMTEGLADMVKQVRQGVSGVSEEGTTSVGASAGRAALGGILTGALVPGNPILKGIVGLLAGLATFATDLYGRTSGNTGEALTRIVEWAAGVAAVSSLLKKSSAPEGLKKVGEWFDDIAKVVRGVSWAELPGKLLGAFKKFSLGWGLVVTALLTAADYFATESQKNDPKRRAEAARAKSAELAVETGKIEAAQATYDQTQPGSRGKIVADVRDQLSAAQAGLKRAGINTNDPETVQKLRQLPGMEKGSYPYNQIMKSLEVTPDLEGRVQELSSAFVDARNRLQGLIVDEYGTLVDALSDKLPDKAIQTATIQSKKTLSTLKALNGSDTLKDVLDQANTLLAYMDDISGNLKDRVKKSRDQQAGQEVAGLEGESPEAIGVLIRQKQAAGDAEGLQALAKSLQLEKTRAESEKQAFQQALAHRVSILPLYDEARHEANQEGLKRATEVFDSLTDLLKQADEAFAAAESSARAAESAQSNRQSDIEISKTRVVLSGQLEGYAGIGRLETDLADLTESTQQQVRFLQQRLKIQQSHGDQQAQANETSAQIRALEEQLKQKETELAERKAGLAAGKLGITEGSAVPKPLIAALVDAFQQAESSNNPDAVSPKGAIGLMQVMPDTGEAVAKQLGLKVGNIQEDLKNPEFNRQVGTEYLRQMLVEQGGDYRKAAAAYNFGPGGFQNTLAKFGGDFEKFVEQADGGQFATYLANIEASLKKQGVDALSLKNAEAALESLKSSGKDSPNYRLATEVTQSRSALDAAKIDSRLATEQEARKLAMEELSRSSSLLQTEIEARNAELQKARRNIDSDKVSQILRDLKVLEDRLDSTNAEREKISRNATDPAFNKDIDQQLANQLAANQLAAEQESRNLAMEELSRRSSLLQAEIEARNAELQEAQRNIDSDKVSQILRDLKALKDRLDSTHAEREKISRNATDPAVNKDIDQQLANQLAANQLAAEQESRNLAMEELSRSSSLLQTKIEARNAELQEAQRNNDSDKVSQILLDLKALKDRLNSTNAEREKISRNATDPAVNKDIDQQLANQLAANQAELKAGQLQEEQRVLDQFIRLETLKRDNLEASIKLFSEQGDSANALRQAEALDKVNRKLSEAYVRRDVLVQHLAGEEKKLYEQQLRDKNDLENYTRVVKAHTDALAVNLAQIARQNDLPAETKEAQAYQASLGNALGEAEKRTGLQTDYRRASASREAVLEAQASIQAAMAEARANNPNLDLSEDTKRVRELDKQAEDYAKSMAEISAALYRLDVTPLQALADVSLTNLIEGLNGLSYSAQNLQHTLEGQLVGGIDQVITGLADFITHGEQARQAAENMRQAVTALRDAQLQYNTVLVDRSRAAFEARQEANARVLDKQRDLLARGASPEELAALEQNAKPLRQAAFQSAMQPQTDREAAAAQAVRQAEKDKKRTERENSLFGRTASAIGDMGRGVLQTVVQSTLLESTKNFLGLGDRGSSANNALWVRIAGGPGSGDSGVAAGPGALPEPSSLSQAGEALSNSWLGRKVKSWWGSDTPPAPAPTPEGVTLDTAPDNAPLPVYFAGNPADQAEKKLIENTSDTLDKPLQGFTNGVRGAFDTVVDGVSYVGSSLYGIGKQFLAMMNPQEDTGAKIFNILGVVSSLAGPVAGLAGSFGAGGGFANSPSSGEVAKGSGSLSSSGLSNSSFASAGDMFPSLKAEGGYIQGPGTSTSDSIPARLSDGEYVIKASAVQAFGRQNLDRINQFRFANGGFVNKSAPPSLSSFSNSPSSGYNAPTGNSTQIQIVDQRTVGSPDIETQRQKDTMGREQIRFLVRDEIKSSINSGAMDKTFRDNYGSRRPGFQR